MCNKEISSNPPFLVLLLAFSLTASQTFILGQIRSVCLAATLVLFLVKLKTSYQSFLDDIVYSTAFGAFIGSTLGQVYKEEPLSWVMLAIFFIFVWWTKESKYDEQKIEYVKWYTVVWAILETATAIFRVESYLLKVLMTSAFAASITYLVLRWMKKTNQEVLNYTVYVGGSTAGLCLFIWWLVNLCLGKGLIPADEANSYAFVIVVILLMFSMKIFGLRDDYLDEVFQKCFVAILIIFPTIIAVLIHPILLVLIFAVAGASFGYMFYYEQKEKAKKADGMVKNDIFDYVLGPLYLSIAMGLMVWIFRNYMESGGSNIQETSSVYLMETGNSNMEGSSIVDFVESGDSPIVE